MIYKKKTIEKKKSIVKKVILNQISFNLEKFDDYDFFSFYLPTIVTFSELQ